MKISLMIKHLEQIRQREGDIEVVGRDGTPLTFIDVEDGNGSRVYTQAQRALITRNPGDQRPLRSDPLG